MPDPATEPIGVPKSVQILERFHAASKRPDLPSPNPITNTFVKTIHNGDTVVKGGRGETLTADFEHLESVAKRFAAEYDTVAAKASAKGVKADGQMGVPLDVLTPIMAMDHVLREMEGDTDASELSRRNNEIYDEHGQRSLSEFFQKGNPTFTCTEESMLTQFLLQAADTGRQVTLVTRGLFENKGIDFTERSFDTETHSHVFLLLYGQDSQGQFQDGYIYDPTNPIVFADPNNQGQTIYYPAIQPLNRDQFVAITKGGGLVIDFQNMKQHRRTYGTI